MRTGHNKLKRVYPRDKPKEENEVKGKAPAGHIWPAEGLTIEHLDKNPRTFYSAKELHKAAREKGVSVGSYYG